MIFAALRLRDKVAAEVVARSKDLKCQCMKIVKFYRAYPCTITASSKLSLYRLIHMTLCLGTM
jgi:hypothetical protein